MENLKKAKERAEDYLYRIIEQKWSGIVNDDKRKLAKNYYKEMDWPLRFEAYSYLGNKYKSNVNSFAVELRELWNEWIKLNKKSLLGSEKFFWPSVYEIDMPIGSGGNVARLPGNEIGNHVSMFRVKEILRIGGFDSYFNEVKKRLIEILFSNPNISLNVNVIRNLWNFVRSPSLKFELSDHLKVIALKLMEHKDFVFHDLTPTSQGKFAFFFCFSNVRSDLFDSIKKAALKLNDEQAENGSFEDNVLTTCLCASTIRHMKLDLSNSVCSKAIDYILKNQNQKGYWDSFLCGFSFQGYSTDWNVLSTVVVLETLDLLTNDKPLPIWVEKAKLSDIHNKQKSLRLQPIIHFKTPEGINWHDVSIRFVSEESVQIRAGSASEGRDFIGMGFEYRQKGEPDLCWKALKEFAKHQGEISLNDEDVNFRIKKNLKYYVYVIRQRLKELFKISGDPFEKYNRKTRAWKAKFAVMDTTQE